MADTQLVNRIGSYLVFPWPFEVGMKALDNTLRFVPRNEAMELIKRKEAFDHYAVGVMGSKNIGRRQADELIWNAIGKGMDILVPWLVEELESGPKPVELVSIRIEADQIIPPSELAQSTLTSTDDGTTEIPPMGTADVETAKEAAPIRSISGKKKTPSQMNKIELLDLAREMDIKVPEDFARAKILHLIYQTKREQQQQPPPPAAAQG